MNANRPASVRPADVCAAGVRSRTAPKPRDATERGVPFGDDDTSITAGPRILFAAVSPPPALLQGIAAFARERAWRLNTDMLHTGVLPARWDGDGILALATAASDPTGLVAALGLPCVTLSLTSSCQAKPRIQPDDVAIGRLAAEHLLERQCQEFIWAPFHDDASNHERLRGFRLALRARGCDCELLPPAHRRIGQAWHDNAAEWREALWHRLERARGVLGLFAANDALSARVLHLAQEARRAVPQSLAILGIGNDPLDCGATRVPLSSIDLDLDGLARRAGLMLTDLLERRQPPASLVAHPPGAVVVRDSTGPDQRDGFRLHQALAYLAKHRTDPDLNVAVVADRIGISRRQLERDFRNLKGCTIREYIEELRMQTAAQLILAYPRVKILAIAENVGIADPTRFFRIFRRKFGMTPAAFRRQFAPAGEQPRLDRLGFDGPPVPGPALQAI